MRRLVLGTAGHIDHGKTALVGALTGVDTDRLPEEKRRGITIELGFAPWPIGPDLHASIIDVPGHERLVHTMVAGATGIDLALLCVAADDGVMPQTREHLDVIALLGVPRGLVVLTKIDLADPDTLALVEDDVRDAVRGTVFEGAPVVHTSSRSGAGLEELRRHVVELASDLPVRDASGPAFLPLDRVFQKHGFGTIATGTLARGSLRVGEIVSAWGERAQGLVGFKVRGLQTSGAPAERVDAGTRVAVNLAGRDVEALVRGMALTQSEVPPLCHACVVDLHVLRHAAPLENEELAVHLGTSEHTAAVLPLGTTALGAGERGPVLARFAIPVASYAGQRVLLRRPGLARGATIAGGVVLDPRPPDVKGSPRRLAEIATEIAGDLASRLTALALAARADGIGADDLTWRLPPSDAETALARLVSTGTLVAVGGRFVHASFVEETSRALVAIVERHGREHPLAPGLAEAELATRVVPPLRPLVAAALARATGQGLLVQTDGLVQLPGRAARVAEAVAPEAAALLELYRGRGFTPPSDDEAAAALQLPPKRTQELLASLRRDGKLAKIAAGMHYERGVLVEVTDRVIAALRERTELSAGDFKDLLGGISRKYAIPLLEHLDQKKVTLRVGDVRRLHPSRR